MSEKVRPGREQGHVAVAAVRVLAHRLSRPPSVQEVADLLGERAFNAPSRHASVSGPAGFWIAVALQYLGIEVTPNPVRA
jgi:hypothetical protein